MYNVVGKYPAPSFFSVYNISLIYSVFRVP